MWSIILLLVFELVIELWNWTEANFTRMADKAMLEKQRSGLILHQRNKEFFIK